MKSMKMMLGGLGVALGALALNPQPAKATCAPNSYVSTICWTAATFCPRDFAYAAGTIVAINDFAALYSLVGTAFGGNGINTFGIPDLRGRSMVGTGTGIGLTPVARGQMFGHEDKILTTANLPAHAHQAAVAFSYGSEIKASSATGDEASPQLAYPAARPASGGPPPGRRQIYNNVAPDNTDMAANIAVATTSPTAITTEPWGSPVTPQDEIGLRPPQTPLLPCIAMNGIFPPRP